MIPNSESGIGFLGRLHFFLLSSDNKVSLGLVEGVNNKILILQRRAYGYRDEEYLKLKIIAAFLSQLPRNANISPHASA